VAADKDFGRGKMLTSYRRQKKRAPMLSNSFVISAHASRCRAGGAYVPTVLVGIYAPSRWAHT
jgi:hypothetical protein